MASNESEFGTNSPDKEERKKLRKKRVEKSNPNGESPSGDDSLEKEFTVTTKTGQQQVEESLSLIDTQKYYGLKAVTNVRVKTNDLEARRRLQDEDVKKTRLAKLQQEALTSAKANAAIEMKWAELLEKEIPQELHQEIQKQMESCEAIIKSKDELINNFTQQLKSKDEEYVSTLRQHAQDIENLLGKEKDFHKEDLDSSVSVSGNSNLPFKGRGSIRREFLEMFQEYENQLNLIEMAYLDEREALINEQTSEIESMFETRRNKEVNYKESKQKNEENYQKEIEELITRGADQYNKLKIELEMNIQALKQQLEEIRATYQLNTEKLDYNHRVLTELDVEKNAELARYKRRLNKLKGQLNTLVTRFTEMESTETKTNHDLTEDYRNLTLKYKDLQAKFRHFEIADTTKYDEVWTMHEEEVKDLVDQLLKADKIITEQQLGWIWKAPDIQALQQALGRHGGGLVSLQQKEEQEAQAQAALNEGAKGTETNLDQTGDNTIIGDNPMTPATPGMTPGSAGGIVETGEEAAAALKQSRKIAGYRVRAVLKVLATEAGFMINPEVVASLEGLPDDEADLSRAETLLKALGVKSEEKLNILVNYFFREKSSESLEYEANIEEEGDFENELALLLNNPPEEVAKLKDMIRPEDVISAVKAYIEDMSVEAGPVGVSAAVTGGTKVTQEEIRIAQKRLASMRNYWIQLSQVVNDDSVSVWKQLETDCHHLKEMLDKRSQQIQDVDQLTKQNAELKSLLNQYLGDAVTNATLKVPPAQVMRVRDGSQKQQQQQQERVPRQLVQGNGTGTVGQGNKVKGFKTLTNNAKRQPQGLRTGNDIGGLGDTGPEDFSQTA